MNAIIYNVRDLYDKATKGNNPKTYLTCKIHKPMFENELYPRKEIQVKDLDYGYCPESIALSDDQYESLKQEKLDILSKVIEADLFEEEEMLFVKN